jgi:hypothetical protein
MKQTFMSAIVVVAMCALAAPGWSAGGAQDESAVAFGPVAAPVSVSVAPSFSIANSDHVANGVALRDRCSGTIGLRGIPTGSTINNAFLYWNYMDTNVTGPATDTELFNGNLVTGTKVADQPDLCWLTSGDHTYRATVTPFVPSTRSPEDYTFGALRCMDTSGANPWNPVVNGGLKWDGASLVVTYTNSGTSGHRVAIFDALHGAANGTGALVSSFTVNMNTGATVFTGSGLFTQIGADGQTGQGGASFGSALSGETDTFNGKLLAGPGGVYPQSNWDGSNGWPMPELWDTHTLDVTFNGTAINTDTTTISAGNDCIAAVAYVEQQGGS